MRWVGWWTEVGLRVLGFGIYRKPRNVPFISPIIATLHNPLEKYLARHPSASAHTLKFAPMMQTSPTKKPAIVPTAPPTSFRRDHFDRDVALRRLGCMVDLTHGSLSDYSTVHNLYSFSLNNPNRAQSIKWMKQVNYHFQRLPSPTMCLDSTSPSMSYLHT